MPNCFPCCLAQSRPKKPASSLMPSPNKPMNASLQTSHESLLLASLTDCRRRASLKCDETRPINSRVTTMRQAIFLTLLFVLSVMSLPAAAANAKRSSMTAPPLTNTPFSEGAGPAGVITMPIGANVQSASFNLLGEASTTTYTNFTTNSHYGGAGDQDYISPMPVLSHSPPPTRQRRGKQSNHVAEGNQRNSRLAFNQSPPRQRPPQHHRSIRGLERSRTPAQPRNSQIYGGQQHTWPHGCSCSRQQLETTSTTFQPVHFQHPHEHHANRRQHGAYSMVCP